MPAPYLAYLASEIFNILAWRLNSAGPGWELLLRRTIVQHQLSPWVSWTRPWYQHIFPDLLNSISLMTSYVHCHDRKYWKRRNTPTKHQALFFTTFYIGLIINDKPSHTITNSGHTTQTDSLSLSHHNILLIIISKPTSGVRIAVCLLHWRKSPDCEHVVLTYCSTVRCRLYRQYVLRKSVINLIKLL